MSTAAAAFAPGQRVAVVVDGGQRVPGYLRSVGDMSATVRLDSGEVVEVPWYRLAREARAS